MESSQFSALYTHRYKLLIYLGMALLLMGAKLWMIDAVANPTPYSDQWDAEAAQLYKPWLEGDFRWQSLLAPQNEHRILPTKVLSLWLFHLNELWNPILQMEVNALVHTLAIILLVALLSLTTGQNHLPLIAGTATIIFCTGTGWQNTLHGISSLWYFTSLFGIAALWLLSVSKPVGLKWWLGAFLGLLAAMSATSGTILFAASAVVCLLNYFQDNQRRKTQLAAGMICLLLFLGCYSVIPIIQGHEYLKAQSVTDFLSSLVDIWAWPLPPGTVPGIILHAPAAVFAVYMLVTRPDPGDRRWFLFALAAWCTAQGFSLAYGRAAVPVRPRYTDMFTVDLLANLACLLCLLKQLHHKGWAKWVLRGWLALMMTGLAWYVSAVLPGQLEYKKSTGINHQWSTHAYIRIGDVDILKEGDALVSRPYPDATRLQKLLDDKTIRNILPAEVRGQLDPVHPVGKELPGFARVPLQQNYAGWEGLAFNSSAIVEGGPQQLEIEFIADPLLPRWVELKIHIRNGSASALLRIEQNGRLLPYRLESIRSLQWSHGIRSLQWSHLFIARVEPGPFKVVATNDGRGEAIKFSAPSVRGALDSSVAMWLKLYPALIIIGAGLLLWGSAHSGKMGTDQR